MNYFLFVYLQLCIWKKFCFCSTDNFAVPQLNHSLQMRVNMVVKLLWRLCGWFLIRLKIIIASCTLIPLRYDTSSMLSYPFLKCFIGCPYLSIFCFSIKVTVTFFTVHKSDVSSFQCLFRFSYLYHLMMILGSQKRQIGIRNIKTRKTRKENTWRDQTSCRKMTERKVGKSQFLRLERRWLFFL